MSMAAPVINRELGFSKTHIGLIFSPFAVAYSVFTVPVGWHSDRIGARKGMLVYGAICACSLSFAFFCSEIADSPLRVTGTGFEHCTGPSRPGVI